MGNDSPPVERDKAPYATKTAKLYDGVPRCCDLTRMRTVKVKTLLKVSR